MNRNKPRQMLKSQIKVSNLESHKDYKPKPAENLTEMFNNPDLRSHSNLKLLLSTQVINLSVIITPINWVTKSDLKLPRHNCPFRERSVFERMLKYFEPRPMWEGW